MTHLIDLDRYPLHSPDSSVWADLVARCQDDLDRDGMFNLPGFLRPDALTRAVDELTAPLRDQAFVHARRHNIYFRDHIDGLAEDHPALTRFETANRTICADQIPGAVMLQIYEWAPMAVFLAAVMGKAALYPMADPLARVNVIAYSQGQALNWHFDRSEFTTTLLLQAVRSNAQPICAAMPTPTMRALPIC